MVKYGVLLALFALTFLLPGASKGWESVSMWWYLPMLAAALFLGVWIGKRRRDAREREQRRQEMENRPRDYAAGRRSGKSVYYSLDDEHIQRLFATAFEHVMED